MYHKPVYSFRNTIIISHSLIFVTHQELLISRAERPLEERRAQATQGLGGMENDC